jgi:azurin
MANTESTFGRILRLISADYSVASTCAVMVRTNKRMELETSREATRDYLLSLGAIPVDSFEAYYRVRFVA